MGGQEIRQDPDPGNVCLWIPESWSLESGLQESLLGSAESLGDFVSEILAKGNKEESQF